MRLDKARFASAPRIVGAAVKALPIALLAVASPAQAQRDDPGLQLNCANDFFRLCAGVDPSSSEADRCMNRNRPRLSAECRAAVGEYEGRGAGSPAKKSGRRPKPEEED